MPQAKKKAAPKRKAPAKRKPAAQTPEVNRDVNTQTEPQDEISHQDERGMQAPKEGPDADRDHMSPEDEADRPTVTEQTTDADVLAYEPQRQELEHAGFDHYAAENERQAELAAAREEHNRRTGDASR